ncbi:hypothetical protein LR48_Vigan05g169300 [Vigna angularis]|uniref:Uncharacterized protein n=1 Tax=Phaseolus angularis TaxID=3914 RepID=A0A0L9UMX2_PHAAN|nr:hypothetical protein LR48_Vigan05g169300 [Vigna angularis]
MSASSVAPSGPTSAQSFATTTSDVGSVLSPSDHHSAAPSHYENHSSRRWWFGFSNCDSSVGIFITIAKSLLVNSLESPVEMLASKKMPTRRSSKVQRSQSNRD